MCKYITNHSDITQTLKPVGKKADVQIYNQPFVYNSNPKNRRKKMSI